MGGDSGMRYYGLHTLHSAEIQGMGYILRARIRKTLLKKDYNFHFISNQTSKRQSSNPHLHQWKMGNTHSLVRSYYCQ